MNFFDIFPFAGFLLFSILILVKSILLKRKGIRVSSKSGKSTKLKFILKPVSLIIIYVWMFEITKPVFHLSILPKVLSEPIFDSILLKVAGSILITISLLLLIATLVSFKNSLRFGLNSSNLGKLVTGGIFSVSRNPFFVSIELLLIGNALFFPGWFLIGFAFAALFSIHFFILKEEKFMLKNYGKEYEKYCKNVGRYFRFGIL